MNATAQLRLLQLVSPSLPIGSYAYSQGLEYAVDSDWVSDENSTGEWLKAILRHSLCATDLALLRKSYQASKENNSDALLYWNDYVFACRETKEFTLEEQQIGLALYKLLKEIDPDCVCISELNIEWSYVALYAHAAQYWQIDIESTALGYAHAWLENQIAAAIKLVPLGQAAGQRIINYLRNDIVHAVEESAIIQDDEIGLSLPGVSIASCLHETQYSRLFRS